MRLELESDQDSFSLSDIVGRREIRPLREAAAETV